MFLGAQLSTLTFPINIYNLKKIPQQCAEWGVQILGSTSRPEGIGKVIRCVGWGRGPSRAPRAGSPASPYTASARQGGGSCRLVDGPQLEWKVQISRETAQEAGGKTRLNICNKIKN